MVLDPSPRPHPDEHTDAATRWQAHVTAGRLGRRLPADPQVAANRTGTEAIFLAPHRRTAR